MRGEAVLLLLMVKLRGGRGHRGMHTPQSWGSMRGGRGRHCES